jgi:WD40 repeat protein
MTEPTLFQAHSSYVIDLAFSADGRTLISAGMDSAVKLWAAPDWRPIATWTAHDKSVNSLALSPDGDTLATSSTDATVRLWSVSSGEVLHTLRDRKKTAARVCWSGDGAWVGAGWYGGRATVWTAAGEPVVGIQASQKNLIGVAFCVRHAAPALATAGQGGDISLWALPSGEPLSVLSGHETAVMALVPIAGGRTLVSVGYEGTCKFWDVVSGQVARSYELTGSGAQGTRAVTFAPDESRVALSLEARVELRSAADWSLLAELPVSTAVIYGCAFSPDGRWLAAGAADGKIRVWDLVAYARSS